MSLPIQFEPQYQERVWGGRELENVYSRTLPSKDAPFGESWEISDREEAQSIVRSENYRSSTLNDLWKNQREEIFGKGLTGDRFPLLVKILDARSDLSVQVHPPQHLAEELNGEPKTEMWYIADAEKDAKLYVGLKKGTTKETFQASLDDGTVEEQIHAITPEVGDSIFIASGRLHAIGAGFLIYEIQQNSDTTYRVFDWNRTGLDGKPRELHIDESMKCIDFDDFEPGMDVPSGPKNNCISDCEHFYMEKLDFKTGDTVTNPQQDRFSIITVTTGEVTDSAGKVYRAGEFLLLPKDADALTVTEDAIVLQTTIPE